MRYQKEEKDRINAEKALKISQKEDDNRIKTLEEKFAKEKKEAEEAAIAANKE